MNTNNKGLLLKSITVLFIAIIVYLFFSQRIIQAMIGGVVLLGVQRLLKFLFFRAKD